MASESNPSPKTSPSRSSVARQSSPRSITAYGLVQYVFYYLIKTIACLIGVFVFDLRCYGRQYTHVKGGALVLCTHQSNFDPLLVGVVFNQRLNYLARRTLFASKLLGAAISLLNAIELDRDRSGLAGLKETLKRLRSGQKVLVFPEGTRSTNGRIAPLKPGFISVARRSAVPLIPMAIAGAYEALPRGRQVPLRHPLRVAVGPAITAAEVSSLSDQELLGLITVRLNACFQQARQFANG